MQTSETVHAADKSQSPGRRQRRILIGAGGVVALGVVWYLFRPELLFVDKSVHETFPATTAAAAASTTSAAARNNAAKQTMLASGMFQGVAHETKGTATIYELADGKRVLRLTGFETSNGPDVHVKLFAADDASDNDTVKYADPIDLGSLKGNVGDQNYEIPADVDLSKHRAVTIWCQRFGVNFGTAPLINDGGAATTRSASTSSEPKSLAQGSFHSVAHETKGAAVIYQLADGQRVLRLTGFETSSGPDVRVYLVAAEDAADSETVKSAGHIELGKLKGNVGDQNYEVPADVDLNKHRAVTIWCARFGVNFGTAPLSAK
jgi:hypothetical protein